MKEYLSVSEMGALFGVSVQTLHYYDRIGLFRPEQRDSWTGYRKYRFEQSYQLASIRYLRKMGYSVDDVRAFLDSRTPENTLSRLRERSELLQAQWKELMRIDSAIQRKIRFTEEELSRANLDAMELRSYPERRYIPIGDAEQLYLKDSFYFYPTIAFYEGDALKYFGAYPCVSPVGPAEETAEEPAAAGAIPAGTYLTAYYKGAFHGIRQRFRQMREAHPELLLSPLSVNFNIIDQFVERDSDNYVTEIQMRVLTPDAFPAGVGQ